MQPSASRDARPALLEGMDGLARQRLLAACRPRRFRSREIVFHEGDPGESVHIVMSGRVAVRVTTPLGHVVTLSVLGPGDSFGELALLDPDSLRTATVIAIEETHTLMITGTQLAELRRSHLHIDRFLDEMLGGYVRRLSQMVVEALYLPVEVRIARRLANLATVYATTGGRAVIRLTQEDLASMAGTTRATTNKVLQELASRNVLRLGRGRIEVRDRAALARAGG
ncbi:Crp/Fnr family transcriptional regulator [Actinomycetes bacterium KLBMP 9759]